MINKRIKYIGLILLIFITSNILLYSQFGKNKVQYQHFNWKYIESKHFDVYFHDDAQYLAEFAAITAEQALQSIEDLLKFRITKRQNIIIYNTHNQFQQTNIIWQFMPEGVGGVTEMLKNRVVLPFQGNYQQFKHTIHHELVHSVLNDMFYGGTFQTAVSTGSIKKDIPLWMNEGLAEFESIGGYDTHTDMFMRDVSLSENLKGLDYLNGYFAYRGGQAFYWYVAKNYGKERIRELLNKLAIYGDVNNAFKNTFRISFEDFSEKWNEDMKKFYWPDIEKFSSPKDFAQRLTDHRKENTYYNTSPSISPDGKKIAYISDKGGTYSVFIMDVDNKEKSPQKLVSSFRQQDFEDLNLLTPGISWNPKGTQLAISAKAGGEDAIFIVDVEDGDYKKLKFGLQSITSVSWSPNGQYLAFIGSSNSGSDIFLYNLNSKTLVKLTDDVFSDYIPTWSPDSKKIYFVSDRGDNTNGDFRPETFKIWQHDIEKSDIYELNLENRKITKITNDSEYQKTSIAVHPDENILYFVSDKNGIGNIYELNLDNKEQRPITNSLNGILQISMNRDGSRLAFSTLINGGYDIFLLSNISEINLGKDSLPLTKFREQWLESKKIVDDQDIKDISVDSLGENNKLIGYGNYEIEFTRQVVVKPNPDFIKDDRDIALTEGNSQNDTIFVAKNYKLKFSPDIVLGNPGYSTYFGFQGIAQALFSDVMGDHQIFIQANLLLDLRNSTIFAAYNYMPDIIDYQISAFHSAAFVYRSDNMLYRFRNWGMGLAALYPFDMFNRIEWGIQWLNTSRENIDYTSDPVISKMLLVPEGRFVHDDVLYGLYAPNQGSRYYIGFKGSPKFSEDGIGFLTFSTDIRHYETFFNYLTLAIRGTAAKSFGPNPQRFFLGGTENWINASFLGGYLPFDEPEDFAFMEFIMPMRATPVNARYGTQYFLTNFELRFPLFQALLAGPLPILVQGVMGSFFLDIGGAWSGNITDFKSTYEDINGTIWPNDLLMSAGIGIRSYILGLPVKIDISWQNLFNNWSEPWWMFSLGYDF